jgi:hypothetical protein
MTSFISLRNHTTPRINAIDFYALMGFEHKHPELYGNARAPRQTNNFGKDAGTQMQAFNLVFNHPRWKDEFVALIAWTKQFSEEYDNSMIEHTPVVSCPPPGKPSNCKTAGVCPSP